MLRTIGARKTRVEPIDNELAFAFVQENHRSGGTGESKTISLGLFHENELIAVIQFCSPRTAAMKRKYTVELLRLAFKNDVRVIGGASKLISAYIENYNPSDFFTYQDTSGEATAVYEHAGMRLVSQAKKKQYLVAPGKTLETGSRKEVLGMAYATRYGPDRILGTKLGEVYRENGARKTNPALFLEELGWHIEETTGDRVYEWVNPHMSFYTYKITANNSDKYYYGVKRVHKAKATIEDCMNDQYFGSGGKNPNNKFRNWLKRHRNELQKEVLAIYDSRGKAFEAERELIGELWKTDELCLNSRPGGAVSPPSQLESKLKRTCPIHGEVGFIGNRCRSCLLVEQETTEECSIHGLSSHFAGHCRKCLIAKSYGEDVCESHGATLFQSGKCLRCSAENKLSTRDCPVHGRTVHMGNSCALCNSSKTFQERHCEIHGATTFVGDKCSKCIHGKAFYLAVCPIHGETKHKGGSCYKCNLAKSWTKQDCPVHGVNVTFQGKNCLRCVREKKRNAV